MLRFRLELAQSELDSVIPHTVIATTDIQDMVTTRVAITAIRRFSILPNVLLQWSALLLRPSILQASQALLLPLLRRLVDVRLISWLGAIPSQLFWPKLQNYPADPSRRLRKNSCKMVAHSFCKRPCVISH